MVSMRILIVSEDIPARQLGGLGKHAVRLGNALLDQGHQVILMGRSDIDYAECAAEVGFNGPYLGGFDLQRAGWKEKAFGVFMPYKRPALARRIARAILSHAEEFDVVHYHGHLPLVGRYIPEHINFVQTRHDQGSECLTHLRFRNGAPCQETDSRACAGCAVDSPNFLQREISAVAVRQYRQETAEAFARHQTIFVTGFLKHRFQQVVANTGSIKASVINNFIDLRTLPDAIVRSSENSGRRQAIIVGRIDQAKGVAAFLEVLAGRDIENLEIDIVGDGPLRVRLEERFASPLVRFLGWRSQEETLARVARAHMVIVPSIWEEPCGTTILEGLALRKSVFALARGGTPELKRYELWDNQLALFQTMAELVEGLVVSPLLPPMSQKTFQADVQRMLPDFLAMYLQGRERFLSGQA